MLQSKLRSINARVQPGKAWLGPEWLVLGVNNLCNLHCKMCDVGVGYNESNFYTNLVGTRPLHMPLELFERICDQAKQHYPKAKLGLAFTEPLVYKYLIEGLTYANERNLFTSITTNALTLKKQAPLLLEAGLNELYVSLDGPEAIHNEIRGHKSSYRRALEGIEAISEHENAPQVSIYCCITEWNVGQLEEFLEGLKHLPLHRVGFMHTNFTPQSQADRHNAVYGDRYPATASNMEEIDLTAMDLDLLWQQMGSIQSRDWGFDVVFSPNVNTREGLQRFYGEPDKLWGRRCNDAFTNLMIKADGSTIPAHGRCYNIDVGNIYEKELVEIWNSEGYRRFRSDLHQAGGLFPACSRCCSAF